jgi:NNP family nitrate/nitrite transporter-like MFS transporter
MGHLRQWRLGGFILPILFGTRTNLTGIRSCAFMPMCGAICAPLIWTYWTAVRDAEVMGSKAGAFHLHG